MCTNITKEKLNTKVIVQTVSFLLSPCENIHVLRIHMKVEHPLLSTSRYYCIYSKRRAGSRPVCLLNGDSKDAPDNIRVADGNHHVMPAIISETKTGFVNKHPFH